MTRLSWNSIFFLSFIFAIVDAAVYTVCSSGCSYKTLDAAVLSAPTRSTIRVCGQGTYLGVSLPITKQFHFQCADTCSNSFTWESSEDVPVVKPTRRRPRSSSSDSSSSSSTSDSSDLQKRSPRLVELIGGNGNDIDDQSRQHESASSISVMLEAKKKKSNNGNKAKPVKPTKASAKKQLPKPKTSNRIFLRPVIGASGTKDPQGFLSEFAPPTDSISAGSIARVFEFHPGSAGSTVTGCQFLCNPNRPPPAGIDVGILDVGIMAEQVDNVRVQDNYFSECYFGVLNQEGSYWHVEDNRFVVRYIGQNPDTQFGATAIVLASTRMLESTQFYDPNRFGLVFYEKGMPTQFNFIRRNDIMLQGDKTNFPFSAGYPAGATASRAFDLNGVLLYAGINGLDLTNKLAQPVRFNEISSNVIYSVGVAHVGVWLLGPVDKCNHHSVDSNLIADNELTNVPIVIFGADANTLDSNTIKHPRWVSPTTTRPIVIPNSRFFPVISAAIWVAAGAGNCLVDNTIIAPASGGNAGSTKNAGGIVIGGIDETVYNNGGVGTYIGCPAVRTTLQDNKVLASCALEIQDTLTQGATGMWTYVFRGNDINSCAQIVVDGTTPLQVATSQCVSPCVPPLNIVNPALSNVQVGSFSYIEPPFNWALATVCSPDEIDTSSSAL